MKKENREMIARVKYELSVRNWKYKDLASATSYKATTIEKFMQGLRGGDRLERAICTALEIER